MRTVWHIILAAIVAFTIAGQLRAENQQVQIDVQVLSVMPEGFAKVGLGQTSESTPIRFGETSDKEKCECVRKLMADRLGKVLAEPRLITFSGQTARFLCGGQQAVPVRSEDDKNPAVQFREVGTSVEVQPTVKADGKVYMEIQVHLAEVDQKLGIKTSFGFVPGFNECSIKTIGEVKSGSTFYLSPGTLPSSSNPAKWLLIFITPHVIPLPPVVHASVQEPAHAQVGRIASVLVAEYRQACAAGDKDLAAKLGRMALELDPLCLGQTAASAVPRTLPAPMPASPMPEPATPASEDNEYRTPIIPAVREDQPPPACPQPSEKEIIEALNARTGSPKLQLEDVGDEVEIVCEKVTDKVDEPRFFPLVGPARLHHCHWKCTVYYNETVRTNNPVPMVVKNKHVETVYIDKDVLHPTDSESKPASVPVKAEEQSKKQSFRERLRSLFKSDSAAGMTPHKPQYFRPDPDFPLEKELEAMQEEKSQKHAPSKRNDNENPTPKAPSPCEVEPPSCPEPSKGEVIEALNQRGCPTWQPEDIGKDVVLVCEKLGDEIDEPMQLPLFGIAQLHHCHWKCTAYYTEPFTPPSGGEQVLITQRRTVYIDKGYLQRCDWDAVQDTHARIREMMEELDRLFADNEIKMDELRSFPFYLAPFYVDPDRCLRPDENTSAQEEKKQQAPPKP